MAERQQMAQNVLSDKNVWILEIITTFFSAFLYLGFATLRLLEMSGSHRNRSDFIVCGDYKSLMIRRLLKNWRRLKWRKRISNLTLTPSTTVQQSTRSTPNRYWWTNSAAAFIPISSSSAIVQNTALLVVVAMQTTPACWLVRHSAASLDRFSTDVPHSNIQ